MATRSRPRPERFFDGGTDKEPPAPGTRPRIVLERMDPTPDDSGDFDRFRMWRRLGYHDDEYGEILVPNAFGHFPTDLTSVPTVFAWLVPRTGRHLPAALVHDGLISGDLEVQDYISVDGHVIDRANADRVFRDAMRDSGTGVVRRWLTWSAVTLATFAEGVETWSTWDRWRYRGAALLSLSVIVALGVIATLDLFDVVDALPWMGERSWGLELFGGAAGAIVIPLLLGFTWGRFAIAGIVDGIAVAFLLHATVIVGILSGLYELVEKAATRQPRLMLGVVGAVVVASAAIFGVFVTRG